jgi:hypothetical protein
LSDVHDLPWNQIGTGDHRQRKTMDEWGCGWERTEMSNMGQVTEHPLIRWENLGRYRWPDPDNEAFFTGMEEKLTGSDGMYVVTSIFMLLFERMHALRGFQNTLEDLYLETERVERLADRIIEFDIRLIENISARFPSARSSSAQGSGKSSSCRATPGSSRRARRRAGIHGFTRAAG